MQIKRINRRALGHLIRSYFPGLNMAIFKPSVHVYIPPLTAECISRFLIYREDFDYVENVMFSRGSLDQTLCLHSGFNCLGKRLWSLESADRQCIQSCKWHCCEHTPINKTLQHLRTSPSSHYCRRIEHGLLFKLVLAIEF